MAPMVLLPLGKEPLTPKDTLDMAPIVFDPGASDGNVVRDTGCVDCQNVPETGTVLVTLTFAEVPDIAQVTPSGLNDHGAPDCETGCTLCQNEPVTGSDVLVTLTLLVALEEAEG